MVAEKPGFELHVGGIADGARPGMGKVGDGEGAIKNNFQVTGLSFWQLGLPLTELRNNEEECCKEKGKEDQRVILVLTC